VESPGGNKETQFSRTEPGKGGSVDHGDVLRGGERPGWWNTTGRAANRGPGVVVGARHATAGLLATNWGRCRGKPSRTDPRGMNWKEGNDAEKAVDASEKTASKRGKPWLEKKSMPSDAGKWGRE